MPTGSRGFHRLKLGSLTQNSESAILPLHRKISVQVAMQLMRLAGARARRSAIVLHGDPAALELEWYAEELKTERRFAGLFGSCSSSRESAGSRPLDDTRSIGTRNQASVVGACPSPWHGPSAASFSSSWLRVS